MWPWGPKFKSVHPNQNFSKLIKKGGKYENATKLSDFKKVIFKSEIDYVIAVNMLHHTDDIQLILHNIKTSLKPTGKFIIFELI